MIVYVCRKILLATGVVLVIVLYVLVKINRAFNSGHRAGGGRRENYCDLPENSYVSLRVALQGFPPYY